MTIISVILNTSKPVRMYKFLPALFMWRGSVRSSGGEKVMSASWELLGAADLIRLPLDDI